MDSTTANQECNESEQQVSRTNLVVNYLPHCMTEQEMKSLFSSASIGEVESCKIIRDKVTGQSLQYGFVKYFRSEDAEKAINTLNGLRLQNKTIKVSYARPSCEAIRGANLYVAGLPKEMSHQEFEELFKPYGQIITARIIGNNGAQPATASSSNRTTKGVAFIRFDKRIEAQRAVEALNGKILDGQTEPIMVKFASSTSHYNTTPLPLSPYFCSPTLRNFNGPPHPSTGGNTANGLGWCIFVYNLAPEVQESSLWRLFGPFGAVQNVKIINDPQTSKCKGYGFVTMSKYDEAMMAIQSLHGSVLDDRILQVSFKTNKRNKE